MNNSIVLHLHKLPTTFILCQLLSALLCGCHMCDWMDPQDTTYYKLQPNDVYVPIRCCTSRLNEGLILLACDGKYIYYRHPRTHILGDEMPRIVGFVHKLSLRDSLGLPLGCKSASSRAGTPVRVPENSLQNLLYRAFCQLVVLV